MLWVVLSDFNFILLVEHCCLSGWSSEWWDSKCCKSEFLLPLSPSIFIEPSEGCQLNLWMNRLVRFQFLSLKGFVSLEKGKGLAGRSETLHLPLLVLRLFLNFRLLLWEGGADKLRYRLSYRSNFWVQTFASWYWKSHRSWSWYLQSFNCLWSSSHKYQQQAN